MNERIKELITQAGGYWEHGDFNMPKNVYYNEFDVEKFAELIVRECADHIMNSTDRYRKEYFANMIKEHFGVEE